MTIPPTTTMASGRWACEPIRVERAAGRSPRIAARAVIISGRTTPREPLHDGLAERHALGPHAVERRDQQQAVHHGHAQDGDEADGGRDVEVGPGQHRAQIPPSDIAATLAKMTRASRSEPKAR